MSPFINWLKKAFTIFLVDEPLYPLRLSALQKLVSTDFLQKQQESYQYIPIQEILYRLMHQDYTSRGCADPALESTVNSTALTFDALTTQNRLVFIDGAWSQAQSSYACSAEKIQFFRLVDLPIAEQSVVISEWMADFALSDDLFVALNILLSQNIYVLEIAAHVHLDDVIEIHHIITGTVGHVMPRLIIKAGQCSQVTIVTHWHETGDHEQSFVNNLTYISLAEEASVSYYALYVEKFASYQIDTLYSNQKDHSTFTHHTFAFGSAMLRINLMAHLNGSHALARLHGLCALHAKEKVDHHIQVTHRHPHSLSKQYYKCVLDGDATTAFYGKIYLLPAAQQTNAYQTHNAILLSNSAHHYVKPQLEIYADDVKCSHGATVGQLDQEQLFYLQARGITISLARQLLLEAFGNDIIDGISLISLQKYLSKKFIAKLIQL